MTNQKMTDREMLMMCYGAMRAVENSAVELDPLIQKLEAHLYPKPEVKVTVNTPDLARPEVNTVHVMREEPAPEVYASEGLSDGFNEAQKNVFHAGMEQLAQEDEEREAIQQNKRSKMKAPKW